MDAGTQVSLTGIGTGVGVGVLTGIATRNVTAGLAAGAAGALFGGIGGDHVANVAERRDVSGLGTLTRPSVGISLAAGMLAGGALAHFGSQGVVSGGRLGAALGAGALAGGAIALSIINGIGLE